MSFFNMSALAVMLKPMFPQVFARVEELEANGTLQKIQDAATEIASNGTLEALRELAGKIDEHNALLREIRDERRGYGKFSGSSETGEREGSALEAGSCLSLAGPIAIDRSGMLERNEPD